jgi:hypothetical protein
MAMGVTWDKMTVTFTNKTREPLTIGDASLSEGKWGTYPPTSIPVDADGTFVAQSRDDELTGPKGYVKYGSPDGTTTIARFELPYGTADRYLHITFEGSRGGQYSYEVTKDDYDRSNGGAGKRWVAGYNINKA